ncbi:MAG: hypothetical protein BAJATHORv1_20254 [Candidatus Thorarchaeota archaeon]|nr:MAG: hypothetical protein BAJATHORv1_20254 [Candidatus Thorarchaeota archaeon]
MDKSILAGGGHMDTEDILMILAIIVIFAVAIYGMTIPIIQSLGT